MATTAKKAKKNGDVFVQEERPKLDIRVAKELDAQIENTAKQLGTTKNSVVVIGTALFCAKMSMLKKKGAAFDKSTIEAALKELAST